MKNMSLLLLVLLVVGTATAASETRSGSGGADQAQARIGDDEGAADDQERIREEEQSWDRIQTQQSSGDGAKARSATQANTGTADLVPGQQVRFAVQNMLQLRTNASGIGQNVSDFVHRLNQSEMVTTRAQTQIQTRNAFLRFFAGGDHDAAREIEQERIRTEAQLRVMTRLTQDCNCTNQTKQQLQEQLRLIEREQDRLRLIAQEELELKGLFGWMWK